MFLLIHKPNPNIAILDATLDKVNLIYISKFGLLVSIGQHIH